MGLYLKSDCVGNLEKTTTPKRTCNYFGKVFDCELIEKSRPHTYGFVQFGSISSVRKSIHKMS